jgi:hypothetical protein
MGISLLVLPERAYGLALESAARILNQLARILPDLLAGFTETLDAMSIGRQQNEIGSALAAFQTIAAETKSERLVKLVAEPDEGPLSRTLLRLRHDLVIVGRAAVAPLPDVFAQRLGPQLVRLGAEGSEFLRKSATALILRRDRPPLDATESALNSYIAEFISMRNEGLTRALSIDETERVFTLAFALEQLFRDFCDLDRCVREHAHRSAEKQPKPSAPCTSV